MALIIKGKMPEGNGCDGCEFQVSKSEQLDACTCHLFIGVINNFHNERHKDCPIIGEIPDKHGRLGDLDRVRERLGDDTFIYYDCRRLLDDVFDTAPTILEATE